MAKWKVRVCSQFKAEEANQNIQKGKMMIESKQSSNEQESNLHGESIKPKLALIPCRISVREKERENGEENLVLHIRNARMFCVL